MSNNNRVEFANTLRGVAALVVVVSHYLGAFWTNRAAVAHLTISPELTIEQFATPSYAQLVTALPVISLGGFGVALFFLISGFVITFSMTKASVSGFLISRAMRIYPTYIVGFSVTLFMLFMSTAYFKTGFNISLGEVLIHFSAGLRDILGSRNIDSIIWTLEIEMKFYVFVAVAYCLAQKNILYFLCSPVLIFAFSMLGAAYYTPIAIISPSLAVAVTAIGFCGQFIIYMFIGTAINFMFKGEIKPEVCFGFVVLYMLLFLFQWSATPLVSSFSVAWSYGAALLLFLVSYSNRERFIGGKLVEFFANISYPLYVIHGVAGYVALRVLLDLGVDAWMSIVIVFSVVVMLSWVIHFLVEKPTQILGKRLSKSWERERIPANQTLSELFYAPGKSTFITA
jgi:peptidoglycan/LPS O-acetylase OafA/YrhL